MPATFKSRCTGNARNSAGAGFAAYWSWQHEDSFAGPTLGPATRTLALPSNIRVAPPVAWGDVAAAVAEGASAIGIVDGYFEQGRSVWHKEILFALSCGVVVAGAASMGALRAVECESFGMVGIGEVFARYRGGELTDDGDVAQIHGPPDMDHMPLSEPMVNIEPSLRRMAEAGLIDRVEFEALIGSARGLHFKARTYPSILARAGFDHDRRRRLLAWLADNAIDQKRADAMQLVDWLVRAPITRVRRSRPGSSTARPNGAPCSAMWRTTANRHLAA